MNHVHYFFRLYRKEDGYGDDVYYDACDDVYGDVYGDFLIFCERLLRR